MRHAVGTGGALRTLRKSCPTVVPPKVSSSDAVLEALAAGDIDIDEAKAAMARL